VDARSLIGQVLDEGSWSSWDTPPDRTGVGEDYLATLARAAEKSGEDESVFTGEGLLRGRRVAVVACEFSFLAGSIGRAAADG
jgi:acetyl-CoA carboxylase beta subunit